MLHEGDSNFDLPGEEGKFATVEPKGQNDLMGDNATAKKIAKLYIPIDTIIIHAYST